MTVLTIGGFIDSNYTLDYISIKNSYDKKTYENVTIQMSFDPSKILNFEISKSNIKLYCYVQQRDDVTFKLLINSYELMRYKFFNYYLFKYIFNFIMFRIT